MLQAIKLHRFSVFIQRFGFPGFEAFFYRVGR